MVTQSEYQLLQSKYAFPAEEWKKIELHIQLSNYEKGELAIRAGDAFRKTGFILEGIFRLSYTDSKGKETVKAFRVEGELIAPYSEILQKIPSRSDFEAIEKIRVLWISYDYLDQLASESLFWSQLLRHTAEEHFQLKEQREFEFLNLSAQERLEIFLKKFPHYHQRIPQFMIASYLGITPVALSRIMGRRKTRE